MADFVGLFKPLASPRWPSGNGLVTIRDCFSITTWLLLGATLQSALFLIIGRPAVFPAVAILLYKVAEAYAMKTGLIRNPHMDGVIDTKFSAQFPNSEGKFGNKPANNDVCVFILGAKTNS